MQRLNYWFLVATIEMCLSFVLIVSGEPRAGGFVALIGFIFIMVGMIREHEQGRS